MGEGGNGNFSRLGGYRLADMNYIPSSHSHLDMTVSKNTRKCIFRKNVESN